MYQIDKEKRYKIKVHALRGWYTSNNAQILEMSPNHIVYLDERNEKHVFIGTITIYITEKD